MNICPWEGMETIHVRWELYREGGRESQGLYDLCVQSLLADFSMCMHGLFIQWMATYSVGRVCCFDLFIGNSHVSLYPLFITVPT